LKRTPRSSSSPRTNRPDILDPALLRPGRFDRQVTIGLPTQREREQVLRVHVRNKPIADDVNLERLASATPMFSGADLENLTNEAALIAARTGKQIISWTDFNEALDRIILGLRRGSLVPSEKERQIWRFTRRATPSPSPRSPTSVTSARSPSCRAAARGALWHPSPKRRCFFRASVFSSS
jgi:hypothetical protein